MDHSSPYPTRTSGNRVMVFVDGENLAARYGSVLGEDNPQPHVRRSVVCFGSVIKPQHYPYEGRPFSYR